MIFINALSSLRGGGQTYLLHLLKRIPEHLYGKVIVLAHQKNQHIFSPYKDQIQILVSDIASRSLFHRVFFENILLEQILIEGKGFLLCEWIGSKVETERNSFGFCVSKSASLCSD